VKDLKRYTPFIDNEQNCSPELKEEGNVSGIHSCVELLLCKRDVTSLTEAQQLYTHNLSTDLSSNKWILGVKFSTQ
jgi:hypothetical protein